MARGPLVLRTNSQDNLKYKDLFLYVTSSVPGWTGPSVRLMAQIVDLVQKDKGPGDQICWFYFDLILFSLIL